MRTWVGTICRRALQDKEDEMKMLALAFFESQGWGVDVEEVAACLHRWLQTASEDVAYAAAKRLGLLKPDDARAIDYFLNKIESDFRYYCRDPAFVDIVNIASVGNPRVIGALLKPLAERVQYDCVEEAAAALERIAKPGDMRVIDALLDVVPQCGYVGDHDDHYCVQLAKLKALYAIAVPYADVLHDLRKTPGIQGRVFKFVVDSYLVPNDLHFRIVQATLHSISGYFSSVNDNAAVVVGDILKRWAKPGDDMVIKRMLQILSGNHGHMGNLTRMAGDVLSHVARQRDPKVIRSLHSLIQDVHGKRSKSDMNMSVGLVMSVGLLHSWLSADYLGSAPPR